MQKKYFNQAERITAMLQNGFLILCALVVFAFPAGAAQQNDPAKEPQPVGPVNSSNGAVYEKGKYGIIFKYIRFTQDQSYDGNDKVDFTRPKTGKKPYEQISQQYQLTLRAGILDNIDARVIVPFFDKDMERKSSAKDFADENSGIGDIKLIGRYRIWSQKKHDPFNLAVGAGLKIPTGCTDKKDAAGAYPGFLQTGTGSWDPIIELGAHKMIGRSMVSSHFMYTMTTEGERGNQDFEGPDMFNYNFGYAYAVSNLFDLQLECNGEIKGKAKLDGQKQDNTGGHVIYLSPGVHFKITKAMHMGLCAPIAVYRDLNGQQLCEDYRIVAKLAVTF